MRLALVTHAFTRGDGQGRVNYEVAAEALRRGHRVDLLAVRVDPDLAAHPCARWVCISVAGAPTQLGRDVAFAVRSAVWLAQHRAEIDAVLANGCVTLAPSDINAVHFVHGAWLCSPHYPYRAGGGVYALYQQLYTRLNARWERGAFRRARAVVAVSEQVRAELLSIGVPAQRIRVIVNGVDVEEFAPGVQVRTGLGLPEGVPLGLFIGDLRTARKNLDTLLHALSLAPGLHLAVVGDTTNSPYPRMAAGLGLGERVVFLGRRDDVPQLMRAADLVVFPSRYDPFGLVVTEAMASARPVITSAAAGAACLVEGGSGIVLDDPDDEVQLSQALRTLADDPALRARMGARARAIAERHTWAQMAAAYADLLEEVGAASARQPREHSRSFLARFPRSRSWSVPSPS